METRGDRLKYLVGKYHRDNKLTEDEENDLYRIVHKELKMPQSIPTIEPSGIAQHKFTLREVIDQATYVIGIATLIEKFNEVDKNGN